MKTDNLVLCVRPLIDDPLKVDSERYPDDCQILSSYVFLKKNLTDKCSFCTSRPISDFHLTIHPLSWA